MRHNRASRHRAQHLGKWHVVSRVDEHPNYDRAGGHNNNSSSGKQNMDRKENGHRAECGRPVLGRASYPDISERTFRNAFPVAVNLGLNFLQHIFLPCRRKKVLKPALHLQVFFNRPALFHYKRVRDLAVYCLL